MMMVFLGRDQSPKIMIKSLPSARCSQAKCKRATIIIIIIISIIIIIIFILIIIRASMQSFMAPLCC